MGAVAVPKLNIILALMCVQYEAEIVPQQLGSDQICNAPSIHARMGRFMMFANIISGVGCAFSSPRMGALSDRYGRKPLLAFSALGLLFGDTISIAAGLFPYSISVYWVLLEFAIGGLTGSFVTTMAIIQTYAADCTEGEARVSIFGRLHACMYLGLALGPAAGGFFVRMVGSGDMLSVFYAASLCHAGFIGFVLFGIKESLPSSARSNTKVSTLVADTDTRTTLSRVRTCLSACNILRPLGILRPPPETSSRSARKNLPRLACIDGFAFGSQLGLVSVLILYSEYRLGWKTMEATLFVSITNATRAVVLTVVLPMVSQLANGRILGMSGAAADPEARDTAATALRFSIVTLRVAVLFDLISHLGFAMADGPILFTLSGIIAAAGAPVSPTIQSLMVTYVEADKIGELLGTVALFHGLARSLVPAFIQFIYGVTVGSAPGTIFWILAFLFGGTFVLSLQIRP